MTDRRICLAVALVAGMSATAVQLSLPATDDTMVYSGSHNASAYQGNYNAGTHEGLYVGGNGTRASYYRSLLRFDLAGASIDPASVTGATLRLTVSDVSKMNTAGNGVPVGVYCVGADNAARTEGTKRASLADEGMACWAALGRNATPWRGEPGVGTNGVGVACRAAGATVPAAVSPGDAMTFDLSSEAAVAVLRGWADGEPNAGFLMASDAEPDNVKNAVAFASKENTSYAAPQLVVRTTDGDVALTPPSDDMFILSGNAASSFNLTPFADWNWGKRTMMVVGMLPLNGTNQPSRALMRFDAAAAAGMCVTSAVLRLVSHGTMSTSSADPLTLHLKLMANADAVWRETAYGAAADGRPAIDGPTERGASRVARKCPRRLASAADHLRRAGRRRGNDPDHPMKQGQAYA